MNKKLLITGVVVLIVIAIIFGLTQYQKIEEDTEIITTRVEGEVSKKEEIVAERSASLYKDGAYNINLDYPAPGGHTENMDFVMTITNDRLTNLEIKYVASNKESEQWQGRFAKKIKGEVLNEEINNISPARIGGASLTTTAFNEALKQAQTQAQL